MPDPEHRTVILVVEGEPLVRIFIADFMDEAGFKVLEAVDADEALTILRARPDVKAFISDVEIHCGSMNGFCVCPNSPGAMARDRDCD